MRRFHFDGYGKPCIALAPGEAVILLQDGYAEVSRYEPTDEPWGVLLDPAANAEELADDALAAVLTVEPKIDTNGDAATFTCPPDLAARAVWRTQRQQEAAPREAQTGTAAE